MRRRYKRRQPQTKKVESPFFKPQVQAKLAIGKPGDKYEVEADKMADAVVNKTDVQSVQKMEGEEEIQQKPLAAQVTPLVQKMELSDEEPVQQKIQEEDSIQKTEEEEPVQAKCTDCEKEGIQKKADTSSSSNSFERSLRNDSGGSKMDTNTRLEMESSFGADFSKVNIHSDSEAAKMSNNIGAQAFTNGNDIYFNEGKYSPNSKEGKHLLAHELTHTIQQGKSSDNTNIMRRVMREAPVNYMCGSGSSFLRSPGSGTLTLSSGETQIKVTTNLNWDRPANCSDRGKFFVTLMQKDRWFWVDSNRGQEEFSVGSDHHTWTGLEAGEYWVQIKSNNTNPNCCLTGNIKIEGF